MDGRIAATDRTRMGVLLPAERRAVGNARTTTFEPRRLIWQAVFDGIPDVKVDKD
jgi:hypothetical protein